jgi:hypothetical protein
MAQASAAAEAVLLAYAALWSEPDRGRRTQLIETALAADALIVGPGFELRGHAAIDQEAARFLRQEPGLRVVATTGFDAHHEVVRFGIAIVQPDGDVALEGIDVVEFGADGRIRRVLTFWGPLPPLAASWPAALRP